MVTTIPIANVPRLAKLVSQSFGEIV